MALKDDLENEVGAIFRSVWTERGGYVVPDDTDIKLGNDAVNLDATVLYADMADSTDLVDKNSNKFSAEIYKSFLLCSTRIIRSEGGIITAYDGDRVMAVFLGNWKNTSAARAALKINYAVNYIINPAIAKNYPHKSYELRHHVGIDSSNLFVARVGIRNNNDLVWVGRASNHAAKLSSIDESYPTFITEEVYDKINDSVKIKDNNSMWEKRIWAAMGGRIIYRSNWWWKI